MRVELDGNSVCGLYCLQYLARKEGAARPGEIAGAGRMAAARVKRVLGALRRAGLVDVRRGRGWELSRPAGEITIADIQEAVRGMRESGRPCRIRYETCPYRSICAMTPVCKAVHEGVEEALQRSDLGSLASEAPSLPACVERRPRAVRAT
jgi:DNA-binding IscR family transcriptional regulator